MAGSGREGRDLCHEQSPQRLEQELSFEIRVLTGDGLLSFPVRDRNELYKAVDTLLCKPAAADSITERVFDASWQYHVGGEPDES